ncbi:MAG: hypothetical protein U1E40_04045 [Amaricoccus sp.]
MRIRLSLLALVAALAAAPIAAQQAGYSLDQVEAMYPRMKAVHIQKCDRNGDGVYTKSEMLCVKSIYHAMYVEN